jgi:hypothetical protein
MEKVKGVLSVLGILFGLYYFVLKPDYSWKDSHIRAAVERNWTLIDSASVTFSLNPIRWFKPKIDQLTFMSELGVTRINDSLIAGQHMLIFTTLEDEADQIGKNIVVCDCKNLKEYSFDMNQEFDMAVLKRKHASTARKSVVDFLCPKNKSYSLVDYRGREYDVSNLILSGVYSAEEHNGNVMKLTPTWPYIATSYDEELIRNAVLNSDLRVDFINNTSNLYSDSVFKSLQYLKSDLVWTEESIDVRDIYSLNLIVGGLAKECLVFIVGNRNNQGVYEQNHTWEVIDSNEMLIGLLIQ